MKKVFSILFALVLMLSLSLVTAVPAMAEGDVVFSNYDEASGDIDTWNNTSPDNPIIEGFTTNDNSLGQWRITSFMLNGWGGGIGGGGISPATVRIYTDSVGMSPVPGAKWDIIIDSTADGGWSSADFSFPVTGVTLDANATYWFGLEATSGTTIGWQQTTGGSHVFELTGNPAPNTTVGLAAETVQITAISVAPSSINFGSITPGQSVLGNDITVENIGTVTVVVDAWLDPPTGTVFNYLKLNGAYPSDSGIWDDIISSLLPSESEIITTELDVPSTYSAQGSETARLIFEATAK